MIMMGYSVDESRRLSNRALNSTGDFYRGQQLLLMHQQEDFLNSLEVNNAAAMDSGNKRPYGAALGSRNNQEAVAQNANVAGIKRAGQ